MRACWGTSGLLFSSFVKAAAAALAAAAFACVLAPQALAEEAVPFDGDSASGGALAYSAADETALLSSDAMPAADMNRVVYVSRTGTKYHYSPTCSNMRNPLEMTLADAIARGKKPCETCVNESGGVTPPVDPGESNPPVSSDLVSRLAGDDALGTMQEIVQVGFADSCDTVVLATMGGYWDALTATALAGLHDAPVLLTDSDSLSSEASAEIERLRASKVYVAGGTAAISQGVVAQVQRLGCSVERLAGDTAVETALKIYEEGKGSWGKTAIVATSETYHDALSASPYAYVKGAPVFLANASTHTLDANVAQALRSGGFSNVLIAGGSAAISNDVKNQLSGMNVTRVQGPTAYETSAAFAQKCLDSGMTGPYVGVATGSDYYDALTGAALCGQLNAPLILVADSYQVGVTDIIAPQKGSLERVYVFGGPAAVSEYILKEIVRALS